MEGSFYGQLVLGKGVSSSLEEQLAKEARKAGKFIQGQHDLSKNLAVFSSMLFCQPFFFFFFLFLFLILGVES